MKYVKILGLAAVAAMAVMAFVGAGTASATQLCANAHAETNGCGAGKAETTASIEGTSTNAVLESSITTVTCTHSATTIVPAGSTGTPTAIAGEVSALSFGGKCETSGGTECTVTVVNLPYTASLVSSAGGGTLTVTDAVGAGATVKCGAVINCTFTKGEVKLAVTNGSPTAAVATKVELNRAGGLCPKTATWDATYSTTSPAGLTVL